MKKNKRIRSGMLLLSISGMILVACGGKDIFCDGNKERGIIVQPVNMGMLCLEDLQDQFYVIDSREELDSLAAARGCGEESDLPLIDFSEYTLLGAYADGGGCSVSFIRKVVEDAEDQKYVYTIDVRECGTCAMLGFSMNWVLVPKLPDGWMVEFVISRT